MILELLYFFGFLMTKLIYFSEFQFYDLYLFIFLDIVHTCATNECIKIISSKSKYIF